MRKVICIYALLLLSTGVRAEDCALPSSGSAEPYTSLAGLSKRERYLLLNEYMFVHAWTRHSDAVAAGFRVGNQVYGEVLKTGGKFSPDNTAVWRRAYNKSGHKRFLAELG